MASLPHLLLRQLQEYSSIVHIITFLIKKCQSHFNSTAVAARYRFYATLLSVIALIKTQALIVWHIYYYTCSFVPRK